MKDNYSRFRCDVCGINVVVEEGGYPPGWLKLSINLEGYKRTKEANEKQGPDRFLDLLIGHRGLPYITADICRPCFGRMAPTPLFKRFRQFLVKERLVVDK